MEPEGKLIKLLADETFQDAIRTSKDATAEEQKALMISYGIRAEELAYAYKLLTAMKLEDVQPDAAEVAYALARLKSQVHEKQEKQGRQAFSKDKILLLITRVAAVLAFPLLLTSIYLFYQTNSTDITFGQEQTAENYNTFFASPGAKTQVVLPDGSLVWLNSGSSLSCPPVFSGKLRRVHLEGEAYFEVVSNKQVPMLVETDHLSVKVYGTKFNVNAFADEEIIETTLVEGKVTMIPANERKEYALEPGYAAQYRIDGSEITAWRVEDMDAFTGWKDGKLLFRNEQFSDIVNDLERWYNVDIELKDPSLGRLNLYATFVDESIEQVFTILSSSIPIKVDYPARKRQADGSYARRKIVVSRDHNKIIN